jgi:hypothetical protein
MVTVKTGLHMLMITIIHDILQGDVVMWWHIETLYRYIGVLHSQSMSEFAHSIARNGMVH